MNPIRTIAATAATLSLLAPAAIAEADLPPDSHHSCRLMSVRGHQVAITIDEGRVPCRTARGTLRAYLTSTGRTPCRTMVCARRVRGWNCGLAAGRAWPRLASCVRGRTEIDAYDTATD